MRGSSGSKVGEDGIAAISPKSRFGVTEADIAGQLFCGLAKLKDLEDASAEAEAHQRQSIAKSEPEPAPEPPPTHRPTLTLQLSLTVLDNST